MSLITSQYLQKLLSIFPKNYCYAFAYGSAVFKQTLGLNSDKYNDNKSKMIDLILVVDNAELFHQNNLMINSSHYSFLKYFGPQLLAKIQNNFDARVYYNTLINFRDDDGNHRLIKYGIIEKSYLIDDLLDWNCMYISGRLHKPVKIIDIPQIKDRELLDRAIKINHQNALYSSLLLLNENFSEEELYFTIANLSYNGDFRMIIGEDKNKVTKVVKPNIEKFRQIYQLLINAIIEKGLLSFNASTKIYCQDLSPRVILHNLSLLPKTVQQNLYLAYDKGGVKDLDDILVSISRNYKCSEYVRNAIRKIVKRSSLSQSLKGLLTAGFIKSIKYSSMKLKKMAKYKRQ